MTFEAILKDLTDDQLKQGYYELKEWHEEGILAKGIIRDVHKKFINANGLTSADYNVSGVENFFLMEIARRKYE